MSDIVYKCELAGEGFTHIEIPENIQAKALQYTQSIIHHGKLSPQILEGVTVLSGSLKPTEEVAVAVLGLLVLGIHAIFLKENGQKSVIVSYRPRTSEWLISDFIPHFS